MGAGLPVVAEALRQNIDSINVMQPFRVIGMVPAIMVEKWEREIKERSPNTKVFIIRSYKDIDKLYKETRYVTESGKVRFKKPEQVEFYLMSSELPKHSYKAHEEPIRDYRYAASAIREDLDAGEFTISEANKQKMRLSFAKDPMEDKLDYQDEEDYTSYYCKECGNPIVKKFKRPRGEAISVDDPRYVGVPENHFGSFNRNKKAFADKKTVANSICKSKVHVSRLPKHKLNKRAPHNRRPDEYVVCGSSLWQPKKNISEGYRKVSPAWYINKKLPRGFFKYLIADEVHEYKSGTSSIGEAFGQLVNHTEKQILLTGTLFGGMALDIFYLLARLSPNKLKEEGMNFNTPSFFTEIYGVSEKKSKQNQGGEAFRTMSTLSRPGISPHLFPMHLMANAAFLELNDMGYALPPYREIPVPIRMDDAHAQAYQLFKEDFAENIKEIPTLRGISSISKMVNSLYHYADSPRNMGMVGMYDNEGRYHEICEPMSLDEDHVVNKLQKLTDIVETEISEGRKNLVYVQDTGDRSATRLDTYLYEHFKELGYNVGILSKDSSYDGIKQPKSSLDREAWLKEMMDKHDWDILITNPRLVKVGLDLLDFPNIHFYQLGFSTFDYMQASRRSWRISQTKDVKVYTYYYEETIQESSLKHMAKKIDASLAMQGKFSEEGLRAMADNSDGMNALARELLDNDVLAEVTESVHDIFARKNQSFEEMQSTEFQEYEGYIMNPIEGGIERIKEIAANIDKRLDDDLASGKITVREHATAKKATNEYLAKFDEFVMVINDTKSINKGVPKKAQVVKDQMGLDLFGDL